MGGTISTLASRRIRRQRSKGELLAQAAMTTAPLMKNVRQEDKLEMQPD